MPPAAAAGTTEAAPAETKPSGPSYAELPPDGSLQYGKVSVVSLAISYTQDSDALLRYLRGQVPSARPMNVDPAKGARTGSVPGAPAGKYSYLVARLESCLLLICTTQDDGVRAIGVEEPMTWYWALTPERNEGGGSVIVIGVYGSRQSAGPWTKLETIPAVMVNVHVQSRAWFLDNWDKALGMAGGIITFLIGLRFKPGKPADSDEADA